jgi:hypothetical protein
MTKRPTRRPCRFGERRIVQHSQRLINFGTPHRWRCLYIAAVKRIAQPSTRCLGRSSNVSVPKLQLVQDPAADALAG